MRGSVAKWKSSIIKYSGALTRANVLIMTEARASNPSRDSRSINSSKSSSSGTPAFCSVQMRLAQKDSSAPSSCASDNHTTLLPSLIRLWRHCAISVVLPKPALPLIRISRQSRAACKRASSTSRSTA
ncbi:hypothetical protein D3C85_1267320 [compost metagenome]